MSKITLKDIAERAGVSKVAVSAALSGRAGTVFVSDATRRRVAAIAEELGYSPNGAARALATGRSYLVEFWSQNVNNPFFNAVFYSARKQLLMRDYALTLFETNMPRPSRALPAWPADGLIGLEFATTQERILQMLASRGFSEVPRVTMGAYYDASGDYVAVDLYAGIVQAVEHLLSVGCRRIAYLVDKETNYPFDPRHRAYSDVLREAGMPPEVIVTVEESRRAARVTMRDHVQSHGCPDGLLCVNDLMAVGAYRALCDLGIRVPEDVRIVGCDGIEEAEYLECPLSTVEQPIEEMCSHACKFLLARIEDPSLAQQAVSLPVRLVLRKSSAV